MYRLMRAVQGVIVAPIVILLPTRSRVQGGVVRTKTSMMLARLYARRVDLRTCTLVHHCAR